MSERPVGWWGDFTLPADRALFWRIGPLHVWIVRAGNEWRVTTETNGDVLATDLVVADAASREPGDAASCTRLGFGRSRDRIHLRPRTADRPVVVRADMPLVVPPREDLSLYISTPVWLELSESESSPVLHALPTYRLSDTWFGSSTRVGQLCYSSKVRLELEPTGELHRPHRAVSMVRIRNRLPSALSLERLKLPVPLLSVYADGDGRLWTESLTLDRDEDSPHAAVRVASGAPGVASDAVAIAAPRERFERNILSRTFGEIFGLKGGRLDARLDD